MSRAASGIVDAWMQHATLALLNHDMIEPLRRWMRLERFEEAPPVETTIAAMDEAGVEVGLASAWYGPEGPLVANDEVAGFCAAHPDRLRGVASVDIRRPVEAVRELRRCVEELGFVALRVVPWLWEVPPTDRRLYPLYTACVELGVPFCTQVGHTGPMRPSETGRPIPYIDQVALDFPDLVIVGGHLGYPWTTEMIAVTTKHPNVYIDTSAYSSRRYPDELVEYMKGHGRDKVMFGTNFPMMTPARALEDLDALGFDDDTRDHFLSANARRVFRL